MTETVKDSDHQNTQIEARQESSSDKNDRENAKVADSKINKIVEEEKVLVAKPTFNKQSQIQHVPSKKSTNQERTSEK